jgi:hypothetical protein
MPAWRREAIGRLPGLKREIESARNVMALWIDIWHPFCRAYEQTPRNEDFIRRIYDFADWCAKAPRTNDAATDPATAVAAAFLEHLPTNPLTREDLPRWFTAGQILQSRQVFSCHLTEQQFGELVDHLRKHSGRYSPR